MQHSTVIFIFLFFAILDVGHLAVMLPVAANFILFLIFNAGPSITCPHNTAFCLFFIFVYIIGQCPTLHLAVWAPFAIAQVDC